MKSIVLLGDSNFCGEWNSFPEKYNAYWGDTRKIELKYKSQFKQHYGSTHPGFQHFLRLQGHSVINSAVGGGSNLSGLKIMFENLFLGGQTWNSVFAVPDMFIIVLTEPLRDLYRFMPDLPSDQEFWTDKVKPLFDNSTTAEELNEKLLKLFFDILQDIYDFAKVPIVLVEGWGKDLGILKNYTFCSHIEKNWIGRELGTNIPMICTMQTYDATINLFKNKISKTQRNNHISQYEKLMEILRKSNKFPDNGHPNYEIHQALADKLKPVIDSIPNYKLPEINYEIYKNKLRSKII